MKSWVLFLTLAASCYANAVEPLLIEAYGDSTTLGISCINNECRENAGNAVAYLQADLERKFGDSVTVSNLGLGGTMATQLYAGSDRTPVVPWPERMRASRARIVTINYGINEVAQNQTPKQFYDVETALVKVAVANGKLAVLATSNPVLDGRFNARVSMMAAMTRRVAQEQHVPLIDQFAYVSALPDWQRGMSDGVHPLASLYKLKADRDFAVLGPIVTQLQNDKRK
jgi:acyl-CoA thioesterase-1